MPTLETIEVPIEPIKPKQTKQAKKDNHESKHVTPPTELKQTTQPKKSKQLGLAAFLAKAPKAKPPVHETPTLDPARRSSLVNIVVGRTASSTNDPTKKLDFDKKDPVAGSVPSRDASPAKKKQKRDHSADDEKIAASVAESKSTPLVVEKSETVNPESPEVAEQPIVDKSRRKESVPNSQTRAPDPEGTDSVIVIDNPELQPKIASFPLKSIPNKKKTPVTKKSNAENTTPRLYKVGDRLEVLWTVQSPSDEEKVEKRWWSATLREDNGETIVLEYDPFPEGGFDEVSRETVTLKSQHTLLCDGEVMSVRREGEEWTSSDKSAQDDSSENDKRHTMLKKYTDRAKELFAVFKESLGSEPPLNIVPPVEAISTDGESNGFPDFAIKTLTALIEGRSEPLNVLACIASEQLNATYDRTFSFEETSSKIKVIATRKNILKDSSIAAGENSAAPVDSFEDESPFCRWEVTVVDLLPTDSLTRVKKARSSHKKISLHWNAIVKLVKGLQNRSLNDKAWMRIIQDEEKFLKFEREEEKARLAAQAKISKQQEKEKLKKQEQVSSLKKAQDEENARLKEEKLLLKNEAAAEKQRKKEEAEKVKLQKQLEKENKEREKIRKQELLAKQQRYLLSMFVPKKKEETASDQDKGSNTPMGKQVPAGGREDEFDVEAFHAQIVSGSFTSPKNPFKRRSKLARLNRKAATRRVTITVDVTVFPENPFESEAYAERRDVEVLNKYKFFLFHEDIRPPYYGTWSKTSKIVTGRSPFKQDTAFLDYEYDSEGEWEEGDDEIGEDCDDDACDEDEEKDEELDDEDGWLADDDEIPEDLDEETKERLRKQFETKKRGVTGDLTVCIIAPVDGKPISFDGDDVPPLVVEGFSSTDAKEIMISHTAETPEQTIELCLDPFPTFLMDEPASESPNRDGNQIKELSLEDLRTISQFVHNSTIASKEKLIDELRSLHPEVTSSRAQAARTLSTIAYKFKSASGASCWRVKDLILTQLDLAHLADTKVASESQEEELMKIVARSIHHETYPSKDKAVDELRLKSEVLLATSRAECLRILDAVATKKKVSGGGFYWAVNSDIQSKLDLSDLPQDAPVGRPGNGNKETTPIRAAGGDHKMSPSEKSSDNEEIADSYAKKRKASSSGNAGSAKLMESFVKRSKAS
jgi:hypothetical protein